MTDAVSFFARMRSAFDGVVAGVAAWWRDEDRHAAVAICVFLFVVVLVWVVLVDLAGGDDGGLAAVEAPAGAPVVALDLQDRDRVLMDLDRRLVALEAKAGAIVPPARVSVARGGVQPVEVPALADSVDQIHASPLPAPDSHPVHIPVSRESIHQYRANLRGLQE